MLIRIGLALGLLRKAATGERGSNGQVMLMNVITRNIRTVSASVFTPRRSGRESKGRHHKKPPAEPK